MDLEGQYKEGVPGTTSVVCKASITDQPVLSPPSPPKHAAFPFVGAYTCVCSRAALLQSLCAGAAMSKRMLA